VRLSKDSLVWPVSSDLIGICLTASHLIDLTRSVEGFHIKCQLTASVENGKERVGLCVGIFRKRLPEDTHSLEEVLARNELRPVGAVTENESGKRSVCVGEGLDDNGSDHAKGPASASTKCPKEVRVSILGCSQKPSIRSYDLIGQNCIRCHAMKTVQWVMSTT
jgi:hypothetical protein